MMRFNLLIPLLLFSNFSFAQRELIHAKDPVSLRSEVISITHFSIPESYDSYAGIRFTDIRYLKGFTGFVQQNIKTGFRKITTAKPFEEELNSAVKIKQDSSALKDSIVVVLKNFWMFRTALKENEMNCHIKALFFTKRADTFFFSGKTDTLFKRNAIIKYEYQDLPALFIEDLLASFPLQDKHEKFYLQTDFLKLTSQQKQLPVDSLRENTVFLSFGDFLKGRIYKAGFSLAEFNEQYRLSFDKTEEGDIAAGKCWGCWYNGQLYIKQGKHYSKAYPAENTFLVLNYFKSSQKEDTYASPLILNMETGKLE